MSNTSNPQNQAELLQQVAAIHEHKPGHQRDLSVEAMTKDLDHITSDSDYVANEKGRSNDTDMCITSSDTSSHADCIRSSEVAAASSTLAGVAGSQ